MKNLTIISAISWASLLMVTYNNILSEGDQAFLINRVKLNSDSFY
jgi:hypothetical protein